MVGRYRCLQYKCLQGGRGPKVEQETEGANESRRGKVAEAVWIGLKRNSGADIGRGDNWGIGRWDGERKKAAEKREKEIKGKEGVRGFEEKQQTFQLQKQKRGIDD